MPATDYNFYKDISYVGYSVSPVFEKDCKTKENYFQSKMNSIRNYIKQKVTSKAKKENADSRKAQKRIERLKAEAEKIENELSLIDEEMNGEAAYDYARLTELDEKKNALEERLMEIYEELEA